MLQISFMTLFQKKERNMLEFVASPIQLFHWQLLNVLIRNNIRKFIQGLYDSRSYSKHKLPMLIRRKEAKGYGTKKLIEGYFQEGENCLIVDDVVTSGSSIVETVQALQNVGVAVTDAVVLLDREQGGRQNLQSRGINLFSVCTLSSILTVLHSLQKISTNTVSSVRNFLKETKMLNPSSGDVETAKGWSFAKRARFCSHPLTRKLFQIMEEKKTNLVLSADLSQCQQILDIVEKVGPCICAVKTHVDILEDFTPDFTGKLGKLADKYGFVIFEDRKFADIGNTVRQQFSGGLYRISEWADIVSAHAVPGDGVVRGLKRVGLENGRGCLLVAEMSSARNLATGDYTKATVKMAEENKDFVIGFICRKKLTADPTFLHMTPGVQLSDGTDDLGQKYLTPATAIFEQESDVIIVGRGILQSDDPSKKAKQFQETAFAAYQKKLARIEEI